MMVQILTYIVFVRELPAYYNMLLMKVQLHIQICQGQSSQYYVEELGHPSVLHVHKFLL